VKEHPILFSDQMVNAIVHRGKTQTRRLNVTRWLKVKPGDWLWVREAHCKINTPAKHPGDVVYRAATELGHLPNYKWIPSIHMRRMDTRIQLRVKSVVVERLWEISDEDVTRELGTSVDGSVWVDPYTNQPTELAPRELFRLLWKAINGPESWDHDPKVAVISWDLTSIRTDGVWEFRKVVGR